MLTVCGQCEARGESDETILHYADCPTLLPPLSRWDEFSEDELAIICESVGRWWRSRIQLNSLDPMLAVAHQMITEISRRHATLQLPSR